MAEVDSSSLPSTRRWWTITELAADFGVTARALRFYEEQGLVSPRRDGLVRRYSRRDRSRLAWICRAKRVGFSLAEIREVLSTYQEAPTRAGSRTALLKVCRSRMKALEEQRREIDGMLEELAAFVRAIEADQP